MTTERKQRSLVGITDLWLESREIQLHVCNLEDVDSHDVVVSTHFEQMGRPPYGNAEQIVESQKPKVNGALLWLENAVMWIVLVQ